MRRRSPRSHLCEMPILARITLLPVRARTSLSAGLLEKLVGETLKELGFVCRRNRGLGVAEFEVVSPCEFLVRVEDLTTERMGYPLRSRVKIESAIVVNRTVGSKAPESEVGRRVTEFLTALRASAPAEPWKGLGILGSRSEKENWEGLGEL